MQFYKRFLHPSDPAWASLIGQASRDSYHEPSYGQLEADRLEGECLAVVVENQGGFLMLPLIIRPLDEALGPAFHGQFDAVSPYGYPGVLTAGSRSQNPDWLMAACKSLLEALQERHICTVFVRTHPLMAQPLAAMAELGTLVEHGETVWLDLTRSDQDFWDQLRTNHRRVLRRLPPMGVQAQLDATWAGLDEFVEIHNQTMRDVNAPDASYFGRKYILDLRAALGDNVHLCTVRMGEELLAGGVFFTCDGLIQYHLGATASRHRKLAPSRMMFEFMRTWGKQNGFAQFHLGGGVGGRKDSLFHFKAGFSQDRTPFYTWRVVINPRIYSNAMNAWAGDPESLGEGLSGFFPGYRMPAPAPELAALAG